MLHENKCVSFKLPLYSRIFNLRFPSFVAIFGLTKRVMTLSDSFVRKQKLEHTFSSSNPMLIISMGSYDVSNDYKTQNQKAEL